MKKQIGFYGDKYYGFGNKLFYFWIGDHRKSTLYPSGWKLNCLGIFGISITGLIHNTLNKFRNFNN